MPSHWFSAAGYFVIVLVTLAYISVVHADGATTTHRYSVAMEPLREGLPANIIKVSEDLPRLVWVDLKNGQMYLLEQEQGVYKQPAAIPISLGKKGYGKRLEGDLKTPVGVYHVTSYLADRKLDSKYGDGAFPMNYPAPFDRLEGRTGSGIWLHGLPKGIASRPRLDSDGCVVLDNPTLNLIKPLITPQETIVVLAEELEWVEGDQTTYQDFLETFEAWHRDWESLNADNYLQHYAADFTDFRRDLSAWRTYKTRVNGKKKWIKVAMDKVSAIAHPEHPDLVVVRYHQDYRSSNYRWRGWKQMLWRKQQNGQWQIAYEGN